jgi:signal transduction histidine kinase
MARVDLSGKILGWGSGLAPSELCADGHNSQTVEELFPADLRDSAMSHFQRACAGEACVVAAERALPCPETMFVPLRNSQGGVTAIFALLRGGPAQVGGPPEETAPSALSATVIRAVDRERRLMAREAHNDLCQQLLGAAFSAKALASDLQSGSPAIGKLEDLARLINAAAQEVRDLTGSHEATMTPRDFVAALPRIATRHAGGIPCRVETHVESLDGGPGGAGHACRIAQEAISNAARHSGASEIAVRLSTGGAVPLRLEIADNGRGFILSKDAPDSGLALMWHRAALAGGHLCVHTAKGEGTTVLYVVPNKRL